MSAASSSLKPAAEKLNEGMKSAWQAGKVAAVEKTGGTTTMGTVGGASESTSASSVGSAAPLNAAGQPNWAKRMQRSQKFSHGIQVATHAVKSGDAHGGGTSVNLDQSE